MTSLPPSQQSRGLSPAQRDMLEGIAESTYGQHCIRPQGRKTADVLVRLGYLKNIGQGWAEITQAGRAAIAKTGMQPSAVCANCPVDTGTCPRCGLVWVRDEEVRTAYRPEAS